MKYCDSKTKYKKCSQCCKIMSRTHKRKMSGHSVEWAVDNGNLTFLNWKGNYPSDACSSLGNSTWALESECLGWSPASMTCCAITSLTRHFSFHPLKK